MDYTWNVMPVYGVSTWVIVMLVVDCGVGCVKYLW